MKIIHLALLILVGLLTIMPAASAATGTGTLYVTNASDVEKGSTATVGIYLKNDFEPKIGAYRVVMRFDEDVVKPISIQLFNASTSNTPGYVIVNGYDAFGYDHGDVLLATVTLESLENDGRASELWIQMTPGSFADIYDKDLPMPSTQNGTFSTKDEVPPVIYLDTPATVSPTFNIAGKIRDVGGMGTAWATLKKGSNETSFNLSLSKPDHDYNYTFDEQVTWPIEDGVNLKVYAIDDAGNDPTELEQTINVVDVGFSDPKPTGYINAIPAKAQAFMSQIDKTKSITMYLGSATRVPAPLTLDPLSDYVKGTLPPGLDEDEYWVNVSGTDTVGVERYLNWTFTLDTTDPVIQFDIADSDGDGYIEAGEDLYLSWDVTELNFDHVALVDITTPDKELWSNTTKSGSNVKILPIDVGNRDLEFRAYDKAGNYDRHGFHLYYNYMIWVNSTKVGEVSGINTTYTAVKDLSRTDVSFIKLINGCTVTLPTLVQLQKNVTNVGQVTSDTYVTVDSGANATVLGSETYSEAWVYDPNKNLDFRVKVPHARNAVLVLAEANESYIAELIRGGKGGMGSIDYMDLIKMTAYIFIDGGWKKVKVHDDGKISEEGQSGRSVTGTTIDGVLRHPDNQVDLRGDGYQLGTQRLDPITLPPGDYALAAIAMDGDRLGILGMMPVMVMESDTQGWLNVKEVVQGDDFTARFATPCERLGVVLIRDVTYKGNALIDAVTLGKETLHLNLTYNDIPATQKLIGNIYVSPSSGKYVVANTNQTMISTSGLDPGSYQVYMVGQSAKGTIQAYGLHPLTITAKTPVEPTPTTPPYTPGRGGGGASPAYTSYTGTGTLKVNNVGTVLRSIKVNADDRIGSVLVPIGVKALDKDGNPLSEVTLTPLSSDDLPAVPSGALFSFAGYVYEAGPSGATFDPGITLTFELPADAWNALDPDNNDFKVKWYNEETEEWEDVPTTTYRSTRSVDAKVTHFSTFALFTEPGIITPPTETETPTVPTTPTPPPEEKPPADKFPMTTVLAIFAVLVIVIAAGYFFMVRK